MGVILDSSIAIRAERRKIRETELLKEVQSITGEQVLGLSAIGVTEIVHGIFRADSWSEVHIAKTFSRNSSGIFRFMTTQLT